MVGKKIKRDAEYWRKKMLAQRKEADEGLYAEILTSERQVKQQEVYRKQLKVGWNK